MIIRYYFLFILVLLATKSHAQQASPVELDSLETILSNDPSNSVRVKVLDQLVYGHYSLNSRAKMYEFLHELTAISLEQNNQLGIFKSNYYRGLILFNMEMDFSLAADHYHKAWRYAEEKGIKNPKIYSDLFNQLGLLNKNLEEFDSAIFYYEKASKINETHDFTQRRITNYINLSKLNEVLDIKSKSIEYAEKCLNLGKQYHDDNAIFHGYQLLGEINLHFNADEIALEYFGKAEEMANRVYGENGSYTSYIHGLLGRLHARLGDHELATAYNKKNINYLTNIYGSDHPQLVRPYFNIGSSFIQLGDYDSAIYALQKGLKSAQMIKARHNNWVAGLMVQLGEANILKNDFEEALRYLELALKVDSQINLKKIGTYRRIADIKMKLGQWDESLLIYQQAIIAACENFTDTSYLSNPSSGQVIHKERVLAAFKGKGEVLSLLGNNSDLNTLQEALKVYQICDTLITDFRHHYLNNQDKIAYNESKNEIYQGAIALCSRLHKATQNQEYIEKAFYFSEKSKSSALFDVLMSRKAIKYANIPDSIVYREEDIKSSLSFYHSQLENVRRHDSSKYSEIKDKIFDLNREHEKLISYMEVNFPDYHNLKYDAKIFGLKDVSENLEDKTLLEYASYKDSIFIFLVTAKESKLISVNKPKDLNNLTEVFRSSLLTQDYQRYRRVAYQLYQTLIEPIEGHLKKDQELVVVPDGGLWHINFELLLENEHSGAEFSEWSYLINSYAISYANSANVLLNEKQSEDWASTACLAFSYAGPESKLLSDSVDFAVLRNVKSDLPGSRAEIKNIASFVPGNYYYGDDANERNFKNSSGAHSLLHLALHGDIEDANPMFSKLFFSPSEADSVEDNLLHIYEVYDMELNADMVVLSACNTGNGKLRNGEGIMSLGRAFQYAGVKSVVFSNWAVPDETAPIIMRYFYSNLKKGESKSQALRNAKLDYLKNSKLYKSNPFYWGNFMIVGDSSSIGWKSSYSYKLATVLSILVVFLLVLVWLERGTAKTVKGRRS